MARKPTHAHEADNGLAEKILSGEAHRVEADNAADVVNDQLHALNVSVSTLAVRIAEIQLYLVHLGKTMGHNGTPQFTPHGENDD